ncbi:mite allergen Der f 3-like [Brevipalpus obovatus]|uniref:mite allergen Der f 3-like n=1 Tax=Brevipalpus obovatus TaxID=246614 RepID=UPI003D9F1E1E
MVQEQKKRQVFGGGSILADKWIITSRHVAYCEDFLEYTDTEFSGKIYENQLRIAPNYDNTLLGLRKGTKYGVEKRFCYPKVNRKTDFVLLKLTQPIPLDGDGSEKFSAIPMIDPSRNDEVKSIIAAGWGANNGANGIPSEYLMQTELNMINKDDEWFIATGNNTSICFGDSGGPGVIRNNQTSTDELIGIAAYVTHRLCKLVSSLQQHADDIFLIFSYQLINYLTPI